MQEAPDPLIVEGVVEAGDQRGRELGFPTANLSLASDAVRGDGVWAGLVRLLDEPDSRPWGGQGPISSPAAGTGGKLPSALRFSVLVPPRSATARADPGTAVNCATGGRTDDCG